ncbi:hypothetical protein MmiHf6_14900 [Methanimicrococcus hongohii]|uniref:Uncharacterized protein n=1 Tax=Methanimicrococcus hongohii TaxID=3028295 RepID=A0AA96V0K0_9EURY|nr:hypothetical protein [Methanimicrococcus sp. Hf6]WNY24161.1 hypothetical protein MmiHf6_14900 [Methanimicrococcus sp. Hf6]
MNRKYTLPILILLLISISLFTVSLLAVSSFDSNTDSNIAYNKMSEEQAEYDFQIYKKRMAEIYNQDVTKEDYQRLRAGTFEMIEAYDADMEKYGKTSDEFNVAYCDHIFVGKVVKHNGNYQAPENELRNPYNLFDVEIIELIKGPELKNEIELKQIGGYYTGDYIQKEFIRESNATLDDFEKYDQGYYGFIERGDSLIEVGEVYLFITTTQLDGRCTIFTQKDRVLLEDFDKKGIDSFDEVAYYKKLVDSGIKDFDRLRCSANEEI